MNWLIIGITGVSCSGKSTLARSIVSEINAKRVQFPEYVAIDSVKLVRQDDYFHPKTSTEHTWLPEFNYINREIVSALNMTKMCADVNDILGSTYQPYKKTEDENLRIINILVIEGFLIFNCRGIRDLCQIKFDLRLSYEECFKRRQTRVYNPANPTGYFERIIWPFYLKHLTEYKDIQDLHTINGELSEGNGLAEALKQIVNYL